MQIPLQLTFRNMEHSDAVATDVRNKIDKLEQLFPKTILGCRVVVEAQHHHHHQGYLFHTRVDITVPGHELVANRESHQNHAHEKMHVSIRDAFDAAKRQLETYSHKIHRKVKAHANPPHGHVSELIPMEDFGRIQTDDGREVYFHRNSLVNHEFDHLEIGDEVRFDEARGDQGPQASTVKLVGKHHILPERP